MEFTDRDGVKHELTRVYAPWGPDTIMALIDQQMREDLHPYTCVRHSDTRLIPTPDGWRCAERDCDYVQRWAIVTTKQQFERNA